MARPLGHQKAKRTEIAMKRVLIEIVAAIVSGNKEELSLV